MVWISLKFSKVVPKLFPAIVIKACDAIEQVGNRGSNKSATAKSLTEENLSSFICDLGGFVTHVLHIYIYISNNCVYTMQLYCWHKRLEEFLLHLFKRFPKCKPADGSGRLGVTIVFKITANAFMKQMGFLSGLDQEPQQSCRYIK